MIKEKKEQIAKTIWKLDDLQKIVQCLENASSPASTMSADIQTAINFLEEYRNTP